MLHLPVFGNPLPIVARNRAQRARSTGNSESWQNAPLLWSSLMA
jgi:hypothetical protein